MDNRNLEDLWNASTNVQIAKGKVFFHYNPKLCYDKILKFANDSKAEKSDDKDISEHSNGNRAPCVVTPLNLTIIVTPRVVFVEWNNFQRSLHDFRNLLGYYLSYREAPHQNFSLFDDQDACSTDSWTVMDVPADPNSNNPIVTVFLPELKSYTQYAIYVKTYTISMEKNGGQSSIYYFTTFSTKPSPPVGVKVLPESSSKLVVTWKPPNHPNGLITTYIVVAIYKEDSQDFLDMRNFCGDTPNTVEPITYKETTEAKSIFFQSNVSSTVVPTGSQCCPCPKPRQQLERDEAERQYEIQFENFLQNTVYIRRKEKNVTSQVTTEERDSKLIDGDNRANRTRRYAKNREDNMISIAQTPSVYSTSPTPVLGTINSKTNQNVSSNNTFTPTFYYKDFLPTNYSFMGTVSSNGSLKMDITNLKHFSEYVIQVIACQNDREGDMNEICSAAAIGSGRTKHAPEVDDVDSNFVTVDKVQNSTNAVIIRWKIPPRPNGLLLFFNVEIKCKDKNNGDCSRSTDCITHKKYVASNGYLISNLLAGNYSVRIRATSMAGQGNWTTSKYFSIHDKPSALTPGLIAGIVIIVIVVLFTAFGGATFYVKKRWGSRVPEMTYVSVNPEYLSNMYVPDEWEIPREKITILKELGQGSFGMVYEGKAKDIIPEFPFVRCAVKTVNESASLRERIEFLNEASVMKSFSCHHVVKLLGVVSKGQPTLVVMELMANGDLKSYLRSHRPDAEANDSRQPPTLKRMLQMAIEIADGMAYLAAQKFVHRDLAARNCMVSENLTVKIGDFGMTRDIYETDYYRKGGKGLLPVRWMAPESLKDGVFTSQSDVWSYGIVIWEMATLASQPYQGLSNEQVLKYVIDGGIMEKPENCPDRLYDLMRRCFHYNPKLRPTFVQLIENLLSEANSNFVQVAFFFNGHNGERDSGGNTLNIQEVDLDEGCEEEALPSTPLRSPQEESTTVEGNSEPADDGGSNQKSKSSYIRHFRLPSKLQSKHHYHNRHHNRNQPPLIPSFPQPVVVPNATAGGQIKSNNTNSSDGSKTSACSMNGGLLNGHAGVPLEY